MKVKLYNITPKGLSLRQHHIFIGISLGTAKKLTKDQITNWINWGKLYTKGQIVFLIADEIARFNYRVFSGYGETKSINRAFNEGLKYEKLIRDITMEKGIMRVGVIHWRDIWNNEKEKIRLVLTEEYCTNEKFRTNILFFVRKYVKNRGVDPDESQLDYLSQYILYELPTLMDGISYNRTKYSLLLYPIFGRSSGMSEFVVGLKKSFPNLNKKLTPYIQIPLVETNIE
ncbi:MAG: tRNA-dependent cyclodipeptide synthase [Candidatus Diapherotrites archaeon]|nr:tRNA-dependent cyclodipeptide synthase [Candidatus Diapherotrites archaeon]